jgi:hypothetical protein
MKSEEMANLISGRLSRIAGHHVIDRDIVTQVVGYHNHEPIDPKFAPARANLARAQEHFFHMQYEDAAAESARAVSLLEGDTSALHEKGRLLFDAFMTQAMIARAAGNETLVRSSLTRAAMLDPIRELDGGRYPPSMVKLFECERRILKRSGVGGIDVRTAPPVAEVYINGVAAGVTPLQLEGLPAGDYDLMIKTNRYAPVRKKVAVEAGRTKKVSLRLAWRGSSAKRGRVSTSTARREIDESLNVAELLKADRAVLVSAEGGRNDSGEVRVRLVDRRYRASFRPIVARYDSTDRDAVLDELSQTLSDLIGRDIASDPAAFADPQGTADPVLLGKTKKKIYRRPLFWGAVGTAVAGAVAGGIVAALGGGGSSDDTGSVRVNFR